MVGNMPRPNMKNVLPNIQFNSHDLKIKSIVINIFDTSNNFTNKEGGKFFKPITAKVFKLFLDDEF